MMTEINYSQFLAEGRELQITAERLRKRGDLDEAGRLIGEAAILHLKAICLSETVPCEDECEYFAAAGEIARRLRLSNVNRWFGAAVLLYLNGGPIDAASGQHDKVVLSGDQVKTYFKDVQKFIHLVRERLKYEPPPPL